MTPAVAAVRSGRGALRRTARPAHAVERHLDGEHLGIDGGVAHEAGDRVEGVVGMVHENFARADRGPDIEGVFERRDRLRRQRAGLEPGEVESRVSWNRSEKP